MQMRVTVVKVGQGWTKSKDCSCCLTSAIMPNMNVADQGIGMLEPENRKVGQCI